MIYYSVYVSLLVDVYVIRCMETCRRNKGIIQVIWFLLF